ncbi:Iron transport multicopper oxidase FET3 [Golovinomyces cichoracearum]|uniref:Iron transport multicopper oxidase FET3 n=1 Tax=Golovinomyces cichoracearum TaxID=62708 RepID=A0A420HMF2_9PEZI|nr:Iron transport multicopper oxidase FET3 [Golovinomyces cichoracearum]
MVKNYCRDTFCEAWNSVNLLLIKSTMLTHLLFLLLTALIRTEAKVQIYDFNITWVRTNPDGLFERPTIGINNEWPPPIMTATLGDRVIVNVENHLGNQTTALHFHGIYHNGTTHMDGAAQVTQCGIAPGAKFTYNFTVNQSGTYWYHSHTKGQYPDGLRAPFIITDPDSPYNSHEELILSVSDWYHEEMTTIIPKFLSRTNPSGAEPVPQSALLNDTQKLKVAVQPNKTYIVHLVNMGAFAGQHFWFEDHKMTIVEVDGVATDPVETEKLYLSAAQRYSFLLTTKDVKTKNYAFVASMDTELFDNMPKDLNVQSVGFLIYDDTKPIPKPTKVESLDYFDDFNLVPLDKLPLLPTPDQTITLDVDMKNLGNGRSYAFFNNITYITPKVPTLYTVLSTGVSALDSRVYGEFSHSFVLEKMKTIEIVVNNLDSGKHPFHLHGHNFQTIARSGDRGGKFNSQISQDTKYPLIPMRRDTVLVPPEGYIVLRFRTDNPGVWLFHCHIEWHIEQGLIATFIEAPMDIQKELKIPQDHYNACKTMNIPTAGNAAANTLDFFDLEGANTAPPSLPPGFTPRGILAMFFSCLSALLGLAVITWYGLADIEKDSVYKEDQVDTESERANFADDECKLNSVPKTPEPFFFAI